MAASAPYLKKEPSPENDKMHFRSQNLFLAGFIALALSGPAGAADESAKRPSDEELTAAIRKLKEAEDCARWELVHDVKFDPKTLHEQWQIENMQVWVLEETVLGEDGKQENVPCLELAVDEADMGGTAVFNGEIPQDVRVTYKCRMMFEGQFCDMSLYLHTAPANVFQSGLFYGFGTFHNTVSRITTLRGRNLIESRDTNMLIQRGKRHTVTALRHEDYAALIIDKEHRLEATKGVPQPTAGLNHLALYTFGSRFRIYELKIYRRRSDQECTDRKAGIAAELALKPGWIQELVDKKITALGHARYAVRRQAYHELKALGTPILPALRAHYEATDDREIRHHLNLLRLLLENPKTDR